MKPRTKSEKEVVALSDKLPELSYRDFKKGVKEGFWIVAYKTGRKTYWCSECGESFDSDKEPKRCPHCKARFDKSEETKVRKKNSRTYFAVSDVIAKKWQCIRIYRLDKVSERGKKADACSWEVVQYWFAPKHLHIFARTRTIGYYYDNFVYYSDLSLKQQPRYACHLKNFPYSYCLQKKALPQFKGFEFEQETCEGLSRTELYELVSMNNKAETVAKQGHWKVLASLYSRRKFDDEMFTAIKIANRNHYPIDDNSCYDWLDMIEALVYLKKDLHNAHYVCPANLQEAHDYWIDMMERKKERLARQREREEYLNDFERDQKADKKYKQARKKFLNLRLSNGTIVVTVLPDVESFRLEGQSMHHCVYANRYFERLSSLIMSAVVDGKRQETVEVDLKTYTISQSIGKCNQPSEYHDSIVELVQSGMNKIREINECRLQKSRRIV